MSRWKIPLRCIWSIAFKSWYILFFTINGSRYFLRPFIFSYMLHSINSKTNANLPVGSSLYIIKNPKKFKSNKNQFRYLNIKNEKYNNPYYKTSSNLITCSWGLNFLSACISLRWLTCSILWKHCFMHLMAT